MTTISTNYLYDVSQLLEVVLSRPELIFAFVILLLGFIYSIVFAIHIYNNNKREFIAGYAVSILLSAFSAFMFDKHTVFHMFTLDHFLHIFLFLYLIIIIVAGVTGLFSLGHDIMSLHSTEDE